MITEAQLKQIMPDSTNTQVWANALNSAMARFEINNPNRVV